MPTGAVLPPYLLRYGTKITALLTAFWLAQLGERPAAEWEVLGSNPGQANNQGF